MTNPHKARLTIDMERIIKMTLVFQIAGEIVLGAFLL
jgi:hypothetical protein